MGAWCRSLIKSKNLNLKKLNLKNLNLKKLKGRWAAVGPSCKSAFESEVGMPLISQRSN